MGQPDPALQQMRSYLKTAKETGAPPPLPPPRPAHDWYEKMYAKLFADGENLYNTMTAAEFELQAAPLLALLSAVTRQMKVKPLAGGDSDATNAVGWPDWFNEMQGMLIIHPNWTWLQEECHRLLYLYACWHLASGEQDRSVFQPIPAAPPPPPPSKPRKVKASVAAKVVEATTHEESGGDTADSGYVEFHVEGALDLTDDPSPPPASWLQIPLIACAAEDEADGGPAAPYRPPAGKPRTVPKANKPKLPLNVEYLFRFIGKSGANVKSMATFVFREKALNTNVTRIEEIGFGVGNWCGPASFVPVKEQLKRRYVYPCGLDKDFSNQWGFGRRITFGYYPPSKVETYLKSANPQKNLDADGRFVRIEDLKLERGDIIWMINQVGPLSGHVATILRSQDASGDEAKMPAMVTWVSGNAGGAPRGCVRVQTLWRVPCEDDEYDYDDISKLGNRRDERRTAYNQSVNDQSQKLEGAGDALATSQGRVDESKLDDAQKEKLAATRSAEAALKKGTERVKVRPTRAYTHWLVRVFKISQLDLLGIAQTYDPLMTTWMARRPLNKKGQPTSVALSPEEKSLVDTKNPELWSKMMMWVPPDADRGGIIAKADPVANAQAKGLAKPVSPSAKTK